MLKIWSMVCSTIVYISPILTHDHRNKNSSRLTTPMPPRGRRRRSQLLSCECRKVRSQDPYWYLIPRYSASENRAKSTSIDLSELSLGSTMKTNFPNPDDILNFTLTIEPDEGMYKGGRFSFTFAINQNFPHEPPKVLCQQKIYHPNIDLEGKVCLNILREDWKPVLNLNAVIVGLQFLFLEPNASDPLNKTAAEDLKSNREGFKRNVRTAMAGGSVRGESFERVMK